MNLTKLMKNTKLDIAQMYLALSQRVGELESSLDAETDMRMAGKAALSKCDEARGQLERALMRCRDELKETIREKQLLANKNITLTRDVEHYRGQYAEALVVVGVLADLAKRGVAR